MLLLLACSDGPAKDDTGTCDGPALADFAAEWSSTYCDWVFACPDPPSYDRSGCEPLYTQSWEDRPNYLPCRAQECLDVLRAGIPACSDDGEEWGDVEACAYGTVSPATSHTE